MPPDATATSGSQEHAASGFSLDAACEKLILSCLETHPVRGSFATSTMWPASKGSLPSLSSASACIISTGVAKRITGLVG